MPVQAGASHRDTEFLQPGQRRADGVLAVRDVVGTPHAIEASELQDLARGGTGLEAFMSPVESRLMGSVFGRRVSEQALEVGEYHVCLAQLFGYPPELDRRIGHRLQIDLTGEDHRLTHRCLLHRPCGRVERERCPSCLRLAPL
jgi:hypothetical protein